MTFFSLEGFNFIFIYSSMEGLRLKNYLFSLNKLSSSLKAVNRSFFFYRIFNFFNSLNFNTQLLIIVFRRYYYWWEHLISNTQPIPYRRFIHKIGEEYFNIFEENPSIISKNTLSISPYSFLIYNNLSATSPLSKKPKTPFKLDGFSSSSFSLYFLRVQRRYNKRRYSKVRASSRPPFIAGITFSSMMAGGFWGASIKNVDWINSDVIIIDVNLGIFIIFMYSIYRALILHCSMPVSRARKRFSIHLVFNRLVLASIFYLLF